MHYVHVFQLLYIWPCTERVYRALVQKHMYIEKTFVISYSTSNGNMSHVATPGGVAKVGQVVEEIDF